MAACGAELFTFEVDFCWCSQELFEPLRAEQGGGSGEAYVGIVDFIRDFDVAVLSDLLHDEFFSEEAHQFLGFMGFLSDRV